MDPQKATHKIYVATHMHTYIHTQDPVQQSHESTVQHRQLSQVSLSQTKEKARDEYGNY